MSRIAILFALTFAILTTSASAQTTIPANGRGSITYTSNTLNPLTGMVHVTGNVVFFGSYVGRSTGSDSYIINPLTGSMSGNGTRSTPDGSSYTIVYQGQFISATDAIGTYSIQNGTGRFAGVTGQGTWSSTRWANQLGARIRAEGTTTLPN